MNLLNDARDQPGELVHINRVDESHSFFYAVWKRRVANLYDGIIKRTQIFSLLVKYGFIFKRECYILTTTMNKV